MYREVLFTYGIVYFLEMRDALTLYNNAEIASNVFDYWSLFLNVLGKKQLPTNPSKNVHVLVACIA